MATKFYDEDRYRIRNWGPNPGWVVLFGHPDRGFQWVGRADTHEAAVDRMHVDQVLNNERGEQMQ